MRIENVNPFGGPDEWYPYICLDCNHEEFVEDIFIDSFPPSGPGDCPTMGCSECGGWNFVRNTILQTVMSKDDPNIS
jgi:hypothetical protein